MNNPFVRMFPPSVNRSERWSHHQFSSEALAQQFATAKRDKQIYVTVGPSSRTDYAGHWVVRVRLN